MTNQLITDSLKHCKTFQQLYQVHAYAMTTGLLILHRPLIDENILSTIVRLASSTRVTASSHILKYSASVFKCIRLPTTFSYNTMMRVQTMLSAPVTALLFFSDMRRVSIPPDFHTYPFAIKASGHIRAPAVAASLHSQTLKFGFISDLFVLNSMIHVYSKLGRLGDASLLFEGNDHKDVISYNALIDGLVKAGDTRQARKMFDKMTARDAVSWGTLIAGYAHVNQCQDAIDLFNALLCSPCGTRPDNVALVAALSACAKLGDLEQGRAVHDYISQNQIRVDSFISTGLVDLYAKCGCVQTAIDVFESSFEKNVLTWNALLVGLAVHGHGRLCLDYFSRMIKDGVQPDGVTFLGVLVACSHAGLTFEARKIFQDMEPIYGVSRELKHYGCMADLLGRAGLIREALEMAEQMPMRGDIYFWGGLLAGCRKHGFLDIAEKVANYIKKFLPEDGGVYSVMVDIYANSDLWDNVAQTRRLIKSRRFTKKAASSLIKINGVTQEFIAGDYLHPQTEEIFKVLSSLKAHQFGA